MSETESQVPLEARGFKVPGRDDQKRQLLFQENQTVTVLRSSGQAEDDWTIKTIDDENGIARVVKATEKGTIYKDIPIDELIAWQTAKEPSQGIVRTAKAELKSEAEKMNTKVIVETKGVLITSIKTAEDPDGEDNWRPTIGEVLQSELKNKETVLKQYNDPSRNSLSRDGLSDYMLKTDMNIQAVKNFLQN